MVEKNSAKKELTIAQNTLWNSFGSTIYFACQWLITILVVVLSDDFTNSGALAIAMAIGNIFSPLAQYRVRPYQVSDVRNEFDSKNYIAFRFFTIAAALLVCIVYFLATSGMGGVFVTVMLYLLFKSDEAFADVLYGEDQKSKRMDYIGISQMIRGVGSLFAFVAGIAATGSINVAIGAMFVSCLMVTVFFDLSRTKKLVSVFPRIDKKKLFSLLRVCFAGALSVFLVSAVVSIPRQLFGSQFGEAELGIFAAIAAPMVLVQVLASYLYSPLLGDFALKFSRNDMRGLKSQLLKTCFALILVILATMLVLNFLGEPILILLYGSEMENYGFLVLPLVVSTALVALMWFSTDVLIVMRKMNYALIGNVVAFVVCIVSTQVFLDAYAMMGIVVSTIIALGFGTITTFSLLFGFILKRTRIR